MQEEDDMLSFLLGGWPAPIWSLYYSPYQIHNQNIICIHTQTNLDM